MNNNSIPLPNQFIVVDDDATSNLICQYMIRSFNQEAAIQTFTNPEQALTSITENLNLGPQNTPIVLLLDINMPSMTGWEFLEEFEKLNGQARSSFTIFILSSSVDEDDYEKAESNPLVAGFISKPLNQKFLKKYFLETKEKEETTNL